MKAEKFVSHELVELKPATIYGIYTAKCACGWSRSHESELLLAIRHQSHMLDAHEAARKEKD